MTLEQLRIFVAVAERMNVTHAARALNCAQSAASHAIASLEAHHNMKLFNRIGRHIELNEAGRTLLAEARGVLARAEAAELALSELDGLKRGKLSVHASQTIAGYWLPRRLVAFRQAYPQIQIQLEIGNTAQVAAAVESGLAELGFVEGAVKGRNFISTVVARDQLVVVVGPKHPWARRTRVTADDLRAGEWVLREAGSGTRSAFETYLVRLGVDPGQLNIHLALPSNEAVRAAVEAGLGATAISASVAAPSFEAGTLRQVALRLPVREFNVLQHRGRYRSRAADALLALIGTSAGAEH